jgi:hypothetical protein
MGHGDSSRMTHGAGSENTLSIAFKYMMASEPYMYIVHLIFQTGHGRTAIHSYLLIPLGVKCFWALLKFSYILDKILGRYYFVVLLFKVSAWLSNHVMCEIGLTSLDLQVVKFPKTQILLNVTGKAGDNQPSLPLQRCL